jgi:hypothetical protein
MTARIPLVATLIILVTLTSCARRTPANDPYEGLSRRIDQYKVMVEKNSALRDTLDARAAALRQNPLWLPVVALLRPAARRATADRANAERIMADALQALSPTERRLVEEFAVLTVGYEHVERTSAELDQLGKMLWDSLNSLERSGPRSNVIVVTPMPVVPPIPPVRSPIHCSGFHMGWWSSFTCY